MNIARVRVACNTFRIMWKWDLEYYILGESVLISQGLGLDIYDSNFYYRYNPNPHDFYSGSSWSHTISIPLAMKDILWVRVTCT